MLPHYLSVCVREWLCLQDDVDEQLPGIVTIPVVVPPAPHPEALALDEATKAAKAVMESIRVAQQQHKFKKLQSFAQQMIVPAPRLVKAAPGVIPDSVHGEAVPVANAIGQGLVLPANVSINDVAVSIAEAIIDGCLSGGGGSDDNTMMENFKLLLPRHRIHVSVAEGPCTLHAIHAFLP